MVTTIHRDPEQLFDRVLDLEESSESADLAGGANISPEAWRAFFKSYLRVLQRQDDLQIALTVRARDAHDTGVRWDLNAFLEARGFDVAELEAEIDAEHG